LRFIVHDPGAVTDLLAHRWQRGRMNARFEIGEVLLTARIV
jgi:hypothetical protein